MRRRKILPLVAAVLLLAGTVAPLAARTAARGNAGRTWAFSLVDEGRTPKRKGNAFARAISAPFRALGKLFGGKKKSSDEARKRTQPKPATAQAAAHAPTADAPVRSADAPAKSVTAPAQTHDDASVGTTAPATALAPSAPDLRESVFVAATAAPKEKQKKRQAPTVADSDPAPVYAHEPAPTFVPAPLPATGPRVEAATTAGGASVVRPAEGVTELQLPKWVPYVDGVAADHLSQGRALLQQGFPNEAISELSVAAVYGPDLAEANNLLGVAYDRLGMHASATEAYERALTVAPDNPAVLNNLGYSLFLQGDTRRALERLKQADRRAPGSPSVLNNIALVHARLGKYDEAFKSFARAFGEYDARLKTAELLEQAGRTADAVKHYEAALKLQPDSAPLLERLADLYERTGRRRDAEAARQRVGKPQNKQKTTTGGGG